MAAFTKYHKFIEDVHKKRHDFGSDVFKIFLTNVAPTVATDNNIADGSEITAQNGYPAGGKVVTITSAAQTGGVLSVVPSADVVFNADATDDGTGVGPFRYAVLYNATANLLISYWDRGSSLTMIDGDDFTVDVAATLFTAS